MLEPSYMAAAILSTGWCDAVLYADVRMGRELSVASCILRWLCEYL
jgi:hypothetical protein